MNRQKNKFKSLLIAELKKRKASGEKITMALYDRTHTLVLRGELGAM